MMRLSPQRGLHGWARGVAALLLALQATAGGAVAIAHASDHFGAPTTLEARHTDQCAVLHDAARCAQCRYAGTHTVPVATQPRIPTDGPPRVHPAFRETTAAVTLERYPGAPPRAPPVFLS